MTLQVKQETGKNISGRPKSGVQEILNLCLALSEDQTSDYFSTSIIFFPRSLYLGMKNQTTNKFIWETEGYLNIYPTFF